MLFHVGLGSSVASLRCQSRAAIDAVVGISALLRRGVRLPTAGGDHPPEKSALPSGEDVDR